MEVTRCKHEIDPKSLRYDKRYGRTCVCKLCRRKLSLSRIAYHPKRERPRMSKKERLRLRRKQDEAGRDNRAVSL